MTKAATVPCPFDWVIGDVNTSNLGVTKSVFPTSVSPGGFVSYNIQVTNNGPDDANNVIVTDPTPAGLTFAGGGPPSQGTFDSVTGIWSVGTLTPGQSAFMGNTYTVGAAVADGTVITNTATATSDSVDPTPANDSASSTVTVVVPDTDIALTKSIDNASPSPGDTVVFTIGMTSSGPDTTDINIRDVLPTELDFVSVNASLGFANEFNGEVFWSMFGVAAGSSGNLTVTMQVPAGATPGTPFTNTATLNAPGSDNDNSNNSATIGGTILAATDVVLEITKDGVYTNTGGANGLGTISYDITVSNTGTTDAQDVTIDDPLLNPIAGLPNCTRSGWLANVHCCL